MYTVGLSGRMKKLKDRPFNGGTLTEAAFFGWIRSGLRRMSIRWRPKNEVLAEIRRPKENGGRSKWEYPCKTCKQWFIRAHVEVNHIIPCGSLKSFGDIGPFCQRLFCEKDGFEILCLDCHKKLTYNEKNKEKL